MRTYELLPTQENLIDTYEKDSIGRNKNLHYFVDILNSVEDCCSVAIDGRWGSGKTFFVKQAKMILDSFNEHTQFLSAEECAKVNGVWGKQCSQGLEPNIVPQVCVYYDAWQFDNDEDPLLSLMYEILNSVSIDYSFGKSKDCISILASIAEMFSRRNVLETIESLKDVENPMEAIKNSREMFSRVNEFLDIVLEERGNRIVIFVDELDRCKPSYAVRLLERIKHYFSKETITFVFSINAMELQHTIKQYYGANFDASRYLDRFFDLRVSLPPANMQKYFSLISADSQNHTYDIVARDVAKKYRFELRELAKYFRLVKIASSKAIRKKTAETFVHPEGKGKWFALMTLVPLMIGLQLYDLNLYDSFVCGENYEPLLDLLLGEEYTDWLCRVLLTPNETIKDTGIQNETVVDLRDKIVAFYDAIFNTTYDNYSNCRKRIGGLTIVEETQSFVKGVVSLLSDCADYAE